MVGGTRRMGLVLAVVALGLASGCGAPSSEEAEARLAQLQAEEERLDAAFDEVETRLLGSQSKLHMWEELGRRHQEVSEVQCRVADAHLQGIAKHYEKQEAKARQLRKRRHMASVDAAMLTSGSRNN